VVRERGVSNSKKMGKGGGSEPLRTISKALGRRLGDQASTSKANARPIRDLARESAQGRGPSGGLIIRPLKKLLPLPPAT